MSNQQTQPTGKRTVCIVFSFIIFAIILFDTIASHVPSLANSSTIPVIAILLLIFVIICCSVGIAFCSKLQKSVGSKLSLIGFILVLSSIVIEIFMLIALIVYAAKGDVDITTLVGFGRTLLIIVEVLEYIVLASAVFLLVGTILMLCKN